MGERMNESIGLSRSTSVSRVQSLVIAVVLNTEMQVRWVSCGHLTS